MCADLEERYLTLKHMILAVYVIVFPPWLGTCASLRSPFLQQLANFPSLLDTT